MTDNGSSDKPPRIEHDVTRISDVEASCRCGWHTIRPDADDLDAAVERHTMIIAAR